MKSRKRGFSAILLGLVVAAGLALTPTAFARTYVDVGVNAPGVSLGYYHGPYHHHGYYGGYYGPAYYGPAYYPAYTYGPTYYAPDYYGSCYVRGHYDRFGYWHPGHHVPC